jgi:hypothetical protein
MFVRLGSMPVLRGGKKICCFYANLLYLQADIATVLTPWMHVDWFLKNGTTKGSIRKIHNRSFFSANCIFTSTHDAGQMSSKVYDAPAMHQFDKKISLCKSSRFCFHPSIYLHARWRFCVPIPLMRSRRGLTWMWMCICEKIGLAWHPKWC